MKERCVLLAVAISVLHMLSRSVTAKLFRAEPVPMKQVVQDFVYVFFSSLVALFVATYLDGPIGYFLSIVANKPVIPQVQTAVDIHPPAW